MQKYDILHKFEADLQNFEDLGQRFDGEIETHLSFLERTDKRDKRERHKKHEKHEVEENSGDSEEKEKPHNINEIEIEEETTKDSTGEWLDTKKEDSDVDIEYVSDEDANISGKDKEKMADSWRTQNTFNADHSTAFKVSQGNLQKLAPSKKLDIYVDPKKKPLTMENCHHCKVKKDYWIFCPLYKHHRYCHRCVFKHFGLDYNKVFPCGGGKWDKLGCPFCQDICPCASCRKRRQEGRNIGRGRGRGKKIDKEGSGRGKKREIALIEDEEMAEDAQDDDSGLLWEDDDVDVIGVSSDEDRERKTVDLAEMDKKVKNKYGIISYCPYPCSSITDHSFIWPFFFALYALDKWEVEKVVACRSKRGIREYRVEWKDSWIGERQLRDPSLRGEIKHIVQKVTLGQGDHSVGGKRRTRYNLFCQDDAVFFAFHSLTTLDKRNGEKVRWLVQWKQSWEPESHLSPSCLKLWNEQLKRRGKEQASSNTQNDQVPLSLLLLVNIAHTIHRVTLQQI